MFCGGSSVVSLFCVVLFCSYAVWILCDWSWFCDVVTLSFLVSQLSWWGRGDWGVFIIELLLFVFSLLVCSGMCVFLLAYILYFLFSHVIWRQHILFHQKYSCRYVHWTIATLITIFNIYFDTIITHNIILNLNSSFYDLIRYATCSDGMTL